MVRHLTLQHCAPLVVEGEPQRKRRAVLPCYFDYWRTLLRGHPQFIFNRAAMTHFGVI